MVIFGYNKDMIRDLQAEIKLLKQDIECLSDKIKSLKGYVYAKKIQITEQEEQNLNTQLPPIDFHGKF